MADVLIKEWDVGAMRRPATNAPSAKRTSGTNFPWDSLNFDPASVEYIFMFGTMPESGLYTAGQDVKFKISWVTDAASVGVVRWLVYLLGRTAVEAWDVAFTDGQAGLSARAAGDSLHVISLTVAGPALSPGDDFIIVAYRDALHGDDTYPVDADMIRVRMYAA